jgi:epoxide hydrolase-like predicted phosphatase
MMIKAVIFDCFGVLTTESFGAFRNQYFENSVENRAKANKLMGDLNAGRLEYDVFLDGLAGLSGISKEKVLDYLSSTKSPNILLFSYIRKELKPKYKIGMLSNAGGNWLKELFSEEDLKLFDDIVLSYEHGLIKPEPDIYLLASGRLGVEPGECVFIDDSQNHCEGARAVGMQAVPYKNFQQMKQGLEEILAPGANN